jgi:hypothetical protein
MTTDKEDTAVNAEMSLTTAKFAVLEVSRLAVDAMKARGLVRMDTEELAEALEIDLLGASPTERLLLELAGDAATDYLMQTTVKAYRKPAMSPSARRKLEAQ